MLFRETKLSGSFVISLEKKSDHRGFMTRVWDKNIFSKKDLASKIVNCNISFSKKKGTIRGLHYQISPYREDKLIRCTRGSIFDVIIDLRPKSSTYKKWFGIKLQSSDYKLLFVPKGFAHGFLTLEDETEVFYQNSEYYMPKYERGIRWDDDEFCIKWPISVTTVSKKDKSWKKFSEISRTIK
ncbi:MAG: dTDP-4-dehydrorhamnose 3,5-epimerase [Nitrosarchaeum sp.]|nr:dTDP-4-dehydrorhamnose 3,5-epimerase [Nitrosarchaeum sp.]